MLEAFAMNLADHLAQPAVVIHAGHTDLTAQVRCVRFGERHGDIHRLGPACQTSRLLQAQHLAPGPALGPLLPCAGQVRHGYTVAGSADRCVRRQSALFLVLKGVLHGLQQGHGQIAIAAGTGLLEMGQFHLNAVAAGGIGRLGHRILSWSWLAIRRRLSVRTT